MLVTELTFHFDISSLNSFWLANNKVISVMNEVFHVDIWPYSSSAVDLCLHHKYTASCISLRVVGVKGVLSLTVSIISSGKNSMVYLTVTPFLYRSCNYSCVSSFQTTTP